MNLFGWFKKEKEDCVVETIRAHAGLHEAITQAMLSLGDRVHKLEASLKELKEKQDKTPKLLQKLRGKLNNLRWRLGNIEGKLEENPPEVVTEEVVELHPSDRELDWGSEEEPKCFQSGKSYLASDTNEAVADGITLQGASGIQYFVQLLKKQEEAEKLLEAQQRMINRLFRIANTTVIDPYKSITDDLRKAEKWKKTLKKKLKEFKEERV